MRAYGLQKGRNDAKQVIAEQLQDDRREYDRFIAARRELHNEDFWGWFSVEEHDLRMSELIP